MMSERYLQLLEEIRSMIERGKSSYEIDAFLDQQELTSAERSSLVQKSQALDLARIQRDLDKDQQRIKFIVVGVLSISVVIIIAMTGIYNVLNSLLSPIGLILIFFGYQLFRRNRKLRQ